jgi:3-hydroxymyristoyl/3-hydroxydecanoyl-(acyl carrier protein) dehydratase
MEKIYEEDIELQAFFKSIYNVSEKKWYFLDFFPKDYNEQDEEKKYMQ